MGGPVDCSEALRVPHSCRGCMAVVRQAACRAGGAHHDDDEEVSEHATAGAGNGDECRGSARAASEIDSKVIFMGHEIVKLL